jgi:hypothetical protein
MSLAHGMDFRSANLRVVPGKAMKHEVILSIVDRKTGRLQSSRAFPSGSVHRDETYIAAVSFPHTPTHWVEVTLASDGRFRVVAGPRRNGGIQAIHHGGYRLERAYAVICYPIDQRLLAVLEIGETKEPKRLLPRLRAIRAQRARVDLSGYFGRLLRLVGLERRSVRLNVIRHLDDRTIARVRRS